MKKYETYINSIKSGQVNHSKWIKMLVEWHLRQVKTNKEFEFKAENADKYIKFIELLEFTQGKWAGNKFILENWQAFFIAMIFGWVRIDNGMRRFKQVTLNVPKKNGKTELGAAIALTCSFLDKDVRGQIFMAATTQDQAAICFDAAKSMVKRIPNLADKYIQRQHRLIVKKNQTYIRYISSEADAFEGKGASVVIFDEEHLQTSNELRDNLKSGMGAREQPLFISISTAGTNKNGVYFQHLKTCKKIVEGILTDDTHLILIYAAPEGKNGKVEWENEDVWIIANPNWGVSVLEENFRAEFTEAKNEAAKQPNFITKKLNVWADSSKTWVDSKRWFNLGSNLDLNNFIGQRAYIGLDLGSTGDFSAMIIIFHNDVTNKISMFTKFYIPEDMANKRSRSDLINYTEWGRQGHIVLTEGDATDYNVIATDIVQLTNTFDYAPIAYDKALASMFSIQLQNTHNVNVESFSQAVGNVTGPTKQFYEWILNKNLEHDSNPVMAWMMSNIEVYQDDANGNYKIHKGKSKNKVDGPCAAVNAIGRLLSEMKEGMIYTKYVY